MVTKAKISGIVYRQDHDPDPNHVIDVATLRIPKKRIPVRADFGEKIGTARVWVEGSEVRCEANLTDPRWENLIRGRPLLAIGCSGVPIKGERVMFGVDMRDVGVVRRNVDDKIPPYDLEVQ